VLAALDPVDGSLGSLLLSLSVGFLFI